MISIIAIWLQSITYSKYFLRGGPVRMFWFDDDFFTLSNFSNHHALDILTNQLVREGMLLDAATAVGDDHLRD